MKYADDLLEQARMLARLERSRPRQSSLRRAVSTAYYALFHELCDAAAHQVAPGRASGFERGRARRSIDHGDILSACRSFPLWWSEANAGPVPTAMLGVFLVVAELQQARHTADYDIDTSFLRAEVFDLIDQASGAIAAWRRIRDEPAARAFLVALLARRGFSRR